MDTNQILKDLRGHENKLLLLKKEIEPALLEVQKTIKVFESLHNGVEHLGEIRSLTPIKVKTVPSRSFLKQGNLTSSLIQYLKGTRRSLSAEQLVNWLRTSGSDLQRPVNSRQIYNLLLAAKAYRKKTRSKVQLCVNGGKWTAKIA